MLAALSVILKEPFGLAQDRLPRLKNLIRNSLRGWDDFVNEILHKVCPEERRGQNATFGTRALGEGRASLPVLSKAEGSVVEGLGR